VIFVKKTEKSVEKREKEIRLRLKNSLPWSLSRWLRGVLRKKT
jgi:hypothetical protein